MTSPSFDRQALVRPSDGVFRDVSWLAHSREQPAAFLSELQAQYEAQSEAPLKSKSQSGIDLYHDLVLRHVTSGRPRAALLYRDYSVQRSPARFAFRSAALPGLHTASLSYDALHQACSDRCQKWAALGLRAGDSLCIVATLSPELLIALLSGLRMGLCVTVLPPRGPDFLARRLAAIPDAKISAAARYSSLLTPFRKRCLFLEELPTQPVSVSVENSSLTYAPEQPALALFSPFSACEDDCKPTVLSAAQVFGSALRDGWLALALFPFAVVSAPGGDPLQYLPLLLLCTLLHGATYLHVNAAELGSEPTVDRADDQGAIPLDVLVVSPALRDAILAGPPRPLALSVKSVQRCLFEALSPASSRWDDFVARLGLAQVACAAWLFDASAGGCLLFSLTQQGVIPRALQVAPLVSYVLSQPGAQDGVAARGSVGLWSPFAAGAGFLLSAQDDGLYYCGTFEPSHAGRPYPESEVRAVLATLPFVLDTVVICEPGDRGHVSLLLFTGPEPQELAESLSGARKKAVHEQISQRLDVSAVPSTIVLFAMFPRQRNGQIDHAYYQREYGRGALHKRERDPVFQLLDLLRASYRPSAKRPASADNALTESST